MPETDPVAAAIDPDGQPLMEALLQADIPADKAYNAVQGVRNMSGQNVIAEIRAHRSGVETSYAQTNSRFAEAIAETNARFHRRIADSKAATDKAVAAANDRIAAAKIETERMIATSRIETERQIAEASRQVEVTQSQLQSLRWMMGVVIGLLVALLGTFAMLAVNLLSRPPTATPVPAAATVEQSAVPQIPENE